MKLYLYIEISLHLITIIKTRETYEILCLMCAHEHIIEKPYLYSKKLEYIFS